MVVSTHIITIYGRNVLLSCGIRIWEVRLSPRMLQWQKGKRSLQCLAQISFFPLPNIFLLFC